LQRKEIIGNHLHVELHQLSSGDGRTLREADGIRHFEQDVRIKGEKLEPFRKLICNC
jgi:hypothetical protein